MSSSRRGRPPSVTEAQIVGAALRVARKVPFDALTMRGLAEELGVGAMTIYNYVPNKDALVDLVADHLLRSVEIPAEGDAAWDERLLGMLRAIRAALARQPGLRFGASSEATRLARGARSILADGGFSDREVEFAFGALWTILLGHAELVEMLHAQPTGRHAARAASVDLDPLFEFAVGAVLDALRGRAQQPAARSAPPAAVSAQRPTRRIRRSRSAG